MRRLLASLAVIAGLVGIWAYVFWPRAGEISETWQVANETLRVRIDRREEICWGICDAYYVFQSSPGSVEHWREFMRFRHDDPVAIPRENIRFVNASVAYAFMGWMYAVTTDAGKTWSVWSAETDLADWHCCNYLLIKDVHIEPSGTGTMTLRPITDRPGEVPDLSTTDFGRHWRALGP